ncbi:uncharacterized protein SEPMUDRAFT_150882 [Sphaerulina musiva SO2202]|uniref:Uncharacterized protein n=1 Tax=Sphaerulina musiva (strain SO2202) TaxID=692275 RepID=N1QER1_SPHMS|nr:uncharacterized protein SEPMUDRAFT_150882 [Sphaerulina musiva SO2202]EMF10940.1 hypothetical protein SEPMUDRAFT_150882 [Sphaerulina musiva SO2202]
MATKQQTSTKPTMENNNVAGGRLSLFQKDPPVGFFKDGYCRSGPQDSGNHSIAATVSEKFLDFTASKGNDLKSAGVKPGQKWCLCASRWKEAMQAVSDGKLQKEHVPKVHLHATHDAALKEVEYKDLRQYAAPSEAGGSNRQEAHHNPASGGTSVAKEHHEISSHDKSMAPGSASSMNKTGSVSDTSAPRG